MDRTLTRTVNQADISNSARLTGRCSISDVCIYLILKHEIAVSKIGREIDVDRGISRILQKIDTVRRAFSRLELYFGDIVCHSAIYGNVLILLEEQINSVNGIIMIPLIEVVSNYLAKARYRRISLGRLSVSCPDSQHISLRTAHNRLCISALLVIRYEQLNPLTCGASIQIHKSAVKIGNSLVKYIRRSPHKLGAYSVIRGLHK